MCNRCIIWDGFPQLNTLYASFNFRCVWLHLLMNFSEAWVKLILSSFNFCYYRSYTADREIFLVKSGGGIRNYLYQLSLSSHGSAESNVLGKLQITWRTNLGEPGRLQTQQILGTVSMLQVLKKLMLHFYVDMQSLAKETLFKKFSFSKFYYTCILSLLLLYWFYLYIVIWLSIEIC